MPSAVLPCLPLVMKPFTLGQPQPPEDMEGLIDLPWSCQSPAHSIAPRPPAREAPPDGTRRNMKYGELLCLLEEQPVLYMAQEICLGCRTEGHLSHHSQQSLAWPVVSALGWRVAPHRSTYSSSQIFLPGQGPVLASSSPWLCGDPAALHQHGLLNPALLMGC